jgi:nitronate monooxygenase
MALPPIFDTLRIPVIGSPLFLVSGPELVIAQCKAGVVGSFPALNARPVSMLDEWLHRITEELAAHNRDNPDRLAAPYAVNQIVHKSNNRLEEDLAICAKWQVPITITSLGAREDLNQAVHGWGGITLHGHAGVTSPFALVREIREWFDGPVALSGSIAHGASVLAAQAMGADLGYIGSAFIATKEANAVDGYKQGIVEGQASDIVYSDLFTGVHGNYLAPSIRAAGMDPDNLPKGDISTMNFGSGGNTDAKAWKDIWGSGQGIGAVKDVQSVAEMVDRLEAEYRAAKAALDTSFRKGW